MNLAKKYIQSSIYKLSVSLVVTALLVNSFMPQVVRAGAENPAESMAPRVTFPVAAVREPAKTITVIATAYNSLPGQADSTPFTTASGTRTRHGVVAANFLRIGTHVRFPELYGDTVFIVEDRMNARYGRDRVDIWMEHYSDAKIFGAKRVEMEIF